MAARISQHLHTVLAADGEQEEAAKADATQIFLKHGLPTIADVGDEAAYEFVVLMCSPGPPDFQAKVPTLHEAPIEDEEHVNVRRAQLGLMRVELYARTVIEFSPVTCPAAASSPEK